MIPGLRYVMPLSPHCRLAVHGNGQSGMIYLEELKPADVGDEAWQRVEDQWLRIEQDRVVGVGGLDIISALLNAITLLVRLNVQNLTATELGELLAAARG